VPQDHWNVATETLTKAHDPPDIEIGDADGDIREVVPVGRYDYNEYSQDWTTPKRDGADELVDRYGRDTLLLTRTKMQAYGIMQELKRNGILYRAQQNLGGWGSAPKRRELYNVLQKIKPLSASDFGGARGLGDFTGDEGSAAPSRIAITAPCLFGREMH